MLNVWWEKDDLTATYFTLNVTWVVILINPTKYKATAQFSTLSHIVQQDYATSGTPITIQDYVDTYKTNLLIGTGSFTQTNPSNSFIDFSTTTNTITYTTNTLTLQHHPILIQQIDYACPSSAPYKYKNDPKCYPCTIGTEIFMNNVTFTEYNSDIVNDRCKLIHRSSTGYSFRL